MKLIFALAILFLSTESFSTIQTLTGYNFAANEFLYRAKKESCTPKYWKSRDPKQLELVADCPSTMTEFSFTATKGEAPWDLTESEKSRYGMIGLLSGPAVITAYGVVVWKWAAGGIGKFQINDEKWFQKTTYTGGVDKLGHAFTHYALTRGYYSYFTNLGMNSTDAVNRSMMATAGIGVLLEVGDALSNYGFSYSDVIVDLAGVALGGLMSYYPHLDELIGYQEQWFNPGRNPESDYDNMRFVLNLKAGGIPYARETPVLKYLSLDFGYGASGFSKDFGKVKEQDITKVDRELFVGLSINFTKLIESQNPTNKWNQYGATLFKYYQPVGLELADKHL